MLTEQEKSLLHKYNVKGSYYTAYPPAGLWKESFDEADVKSVLVALPDNEPMQLYIHFPFCKIQCWYCQCFQKKAVNYQQAKDFLPYVLKEIKLYKDFFEVHKIAPNFVEVHLGGGSPSYLEVPDFDKLVDAIADIVDLNKVKEFAIEIDPRTVDYEKIKHYHSRGINRISFGIQDFNPKVQKAINRVNTYDDIKKLLTPEIRELFTGINFDLIYGLPYQTRELLADTVNKVLELKPDRLAFSVLGYRPDVFPHNRLIPPESLPDIEERLLMWKDAFFTLVENGYQRIGMDHFALDSDELVAALKEKRLFRNSMGYSVGRFDVNIGIGPSGMSRLINYYFQNVYSLDEYRELVDDSVIPVFRGYELSADVVIRREIMNDIMKYYCVDFEQYNKKYLINFSDVFSKELDLLKEFEKENILVVKSDAIIFTDVGMQFLRNVCMVFDNLNDTYMHNIETGVKQK